MRIFVLEEVGVDQAHNPAAQRLILFKAARIEDLEPDLEIRVANQNGRILLVTVSLAFLEPALIRIGVFGDETRIQALDEVSGEAIVDPRTIVLAKDDPGLASGVPNDMLPLSSGTGDEQGPL